MECEEILSKLYSGVFCTTKRNTKSKIWQIFSLVQNENKETISGFVLCDKCKHLFKYNGKQTSNLIRHKCYVQQNYKTELKKVSNSDKEDFINVCAQWVVEDCRPFSSVSGNGFKKLAQALINIGAQYGSHADILDLIPDATTISKRIEIRAAEKRQEIKKEVKEAVTTEMASITTDLWTDNFVKRNFLLPNDEKLIELVRPNQILYDKQCQGYNDDYTKVQLWMKIAEQLSSNAEESAKRWKYLHGRYIRELKRLVVEGKTEVTVEWPLFQRLTFLRKYVKQRNPYPSTTSPVEFSFVSTAMQNSDSLSREDSYISDMCNPFYEISNGGMLVPKEEVNSCGQDVALPKCVSTTENTLTKDAVAPSEGAAAKQTTAIQSFGQTVAVFISEISKPKQAKAMRVLFDALITIKMEPEDT